MKVVITGHTSGLGKAIYDHFKIDCEVIGLSRANGYDLNQNYSEILELAKTADLFFNNAHSGTIQAQLLDDLAKEKCSVVTSGSMAANYDHSHYCHEKKVIEHTYHDHRFDYSNRGLLLKMGYLENHQDTIFVPISFRTILKGIDFWFGTRRVTVLEFQNVPK